MNDELYELDYANRFSLAEHSADGRLLAFLAEEEDEAIRWTVAKNIHTPADVLRKFTRDNSDLVRISTAQNLFTPIDALVILSMDLNEVVRAMIFKNENFISYLKAVKCYQKLANINNDDI